MSEVKFGKSADSNDLFVLNSLRMPVSIYKTERLSYAFKVCLFFIFVVITIFVFANKSSDSSLIFFLDI